MVIQTTKNFENKRSKAHARYNCSQDCSDLLTLYALRNEFAKAQAEAYQRYLSEAQETLISDPSKFWAMVFSRLEIHLKLVIFSWTSLHLQSLPVNGILSDPMDNIIRKPIFKEGLKATVCVIVTEHLKGTCLHITAWILERKFQLDKLNGIWKPCLISARHSIELDTVFSSGDLLRSTPNC